MPRTPDGGWLMDDSELAVFEIPKEAEEELKRREREKKKKAKKPAKKK